MWKEGLGTGDSMVVGTGRWNSSPAQILVTQEVEDRQEAEPGYKILRPPPTSDPLTPIPDCQDPRVPFLNYQDDHIRETWQTSGRVAAKSQ